MPLAYIVNPLDRSANERQKSDWMDAQHRREDAKFVHISGDATIIRGGELFTGRPETSETAVFLGLDSNGAPWFACKTGQAEGLSDLRSLAMEEAVPPEQLGILAQARSMIQWHERRTFCSNCGSRNESVDGGYRRHCSGCGMDHFPRTDPVAIIVVKKPGAILLGRQRSWKPGMYSALAGFVEPGETIEDAARREVFEESGVRVGRITYVSSQPWPFLSNLMIGLIGEALTDTIRLDENELEDARWFPLEEAHQMVERTHAKGFYAANPMAIAHQLVRAALKLD